jgi:hypothetical protein
MAMTLVCAAIPRLQPLPLASNATLRPSSKKIAGRPTPGLDLPLLLQVRHYFIYFGVSADITCSVCCGLSSSSHQCHHPGCQGCSHPPPKLEWAYWRALEPRRDNCLRRDWGVYWYRVYRNSLHNVGDDDGEV